LITLQNLITQVINKIALLILLIIVLIGGAIYYRYRVPPTMGFERLSLTDLNGKQVDLTGLKGKVVLLDFYKSWCGPCMGEMADLGELSDKYSGKLVVLCISDESIDLQTHVASRFGRARLLFYNTTVPFEKLGIHTFPTNFILDKKGNVVYEKTAPENWLSTEFDNKIKSWITTP
jgi:thiol-disulfide isomerase/thioredoxin